MKRLTTDEIAAAVHGTANGRAEVTSVVIDNREAELGSLFVAVKGERLDGHEFAEAAEAAGAAAVMVERDVRCSIPSIRVADTKTALLELAAYYRRTFGDAAAEFPLVGLTGSVGKTTTKEMIACVLGAKYTAHKTYMNWNNEIGVPKVIFGLEEKHTAAVVEMGMDHKGEIAVLSKTVRPNMAVITNVGVSHIENLGSREAILAAKLEITEGLLDGSPLILCADNDMLSTVKSESFNDRFSIRRFGIEGKSTALADGLPSFTPDLLAKNIKYSEDGTVFTATGAKNSLYEGAEFKVELPTIGEHNVYDALSAICVGLELKIPTDDISSALSGYVPAGMREKITRYGGVILVEDCYNASPDSVKALSETLSVLGGADKRTIAVIADMLELGEFTESAHRQCGEYLANAGVDLLMTYGTYARFTAESAKENGIFRVFDFDDKTELSKKLIEIIKPGDVVAFKGSRGMKLEDVIENVHKALGEKGS